MKYLPAFVRARCWWRDLDWDSNHVESTGSTKGMSQSVVWSIATL